MAHNPRAKYQSRSLIRAVELNRGDRFLVAAALRQMKAQVEYDHERTQLETLAERFDDA